MPKFNDLDLENWKQYDDILTDTLWVIEKRDNSGVHNGKYHGNFIPQIPNQLFRRYTKKGGWILDPFAGSGTSLIEARRLGRNAIGIELQPEVAKAAHNLIVQENANECGGKICVGDSAAIDIGKILESVGASSVQFVLFHPPYWDIIKFSENPLDLSNSTTLQDFLNKFGAVIDNTCKHLENGRYCAVVIGDKYANGEIVPLGFRCMDLFLERGFKLKAIIVKNFEETKGKANQKAIWRYRALVSDFYVFKHEYIMVFRK